MASNEGLKVKEVSSEVKAIVTAYIKMLNEPENQNLRQQIFRYLEQKEKYGKQGKLIGKLGPLIIEIEDAAENTDVETAEVFHELYKKLQAILPKVGIEVGEETLPPVAEIRKRASKVTRGIVAEPEETVISPNKLLESAEEKNLTNELRNLIIDDRPVQEIEDQKGFYKVLGDLYVSFKKMTPESQEEVKQELFNEEETELPEEEGEEITDEEASARWAEKQKRAREKGKDKDAA